MNLPDRENAAGTFRFDAAGLEATRRLAAALAERAVEGTVIALEGDLGAGKTAFTQAFARELGVAGVVNSPTFTIIKEYEGRLPLYHMDVYRLTLEEADELGLDEYFYGRGATVIEWAGRLADRLPDRLLRITLLRTGDEERLIRLEPWGQPYVDWCRELAERGVLRHEHEAG